MTRGAKYLIAAGSLAVVAACSQQGKLDIRARPGALAAGERPVPERIAEARGQYALGNVALALEGFRKASREDPSSIDALTGMAACYDRMGRFELSRVKYEAALALAPTDPALLGLLAASLRSQGKTADADQVQREIAALAESRAEPPALIDASEASAATPELANHVERQIDALRSLEVAPPAKDVAASIDAEDRKAVAVSPIITRRVAARADTPLRLERVSMAEVALVRAKQPDPWVSASASTLGLAPLSTIDSRDVRILNAAKIHRLAARTRDWLVQRGWPTLAVADAATVQPDSVIYYPSSKLALAQRLSFEFGFVTVERNSARDVTVVLGRDVTRNANPGIGRLVVAASPTPFLKASGAASAAWAGIAKQASHAIDAGRTEQARAMIGRAVTAGAPPLVTSRLVADLTYKTGDYSTAASLYEALMKVWRDDVVMVERAGMSRLHLGQYEIAARHLEQATGDPGASWQAWNARGVAADARHDWPAAETAYRRALFLAPRRGEVLNNVGWSLALRGRWGEARELLEQAVALEPRLERATRNLDLARAALDQRLPRRGAHESEMAWAAKLNDAGVIAHNQGNLRKAISAFARAIETRSQWFERAVNNLRLAERKD